MRHDKVYVFRPLHRDFRKPFYRYADGQWIEDDGQTFDLAFYGKAGDSWPTTDRGDGGWPKALFIDLPSPTNLEWSIPDYKLGGPYHRPWHRQLTLFKAEVFTYSFTDLHPNRVAFRSAMDRCSKEHGCANGRGPSFLIGDQYFALRRVRDQKTGQVIHRPMQFRCANCKVTHDVTHVWREARRGYARNRRLEKAHAVQRVFEKAGNGNRW
jgi:hypothetical protein